MSEEQWGTEDAELARARYLVYQLENDAPDVIVFGESTMLYVGPDEPNAPTVGDLLSAELAPAATFLACGPGYGAPLHLQYARLAAQTSARPVIVVSLFHRGTLPAFLFHPKYGHQRAIAQLAGFEAAHAEDLRAPFWDPSPEDYLAYEDLHCPTLVSPERTIRDFMGHLRRGLVPGDDDYLRWLFEFHYGGRAHPVGLKAFTDLGRLLREEGFPVVAYQNPVNAIQGAEELGEDFTAWNTANEQAVREAFVAGYGSGAVVLETARWQPEEFFDAALEHLVLPARRELAATVAEAVRSVGDLGRREELAS